MPKKQCVFSRKSRRKRGGPTLGLRGWPAKKIAYIKKGALEKQIRSLKKYGAEEKMQTKHVFLVENRAKKGGHFGAA